MARRRSIPKNETDVELRYANWLTQTVLMLKPKNLGLVVGRGGAKTTDILAQRVQDISYDMPGCYIAISSDTFMNARKNVVPSLIEGWTRNDWMEDHHFVINRRPPSHFGKPYKAPIEWKDSITHHTGTHCKIISQDRPSGGAGDSYQAVVGDEVKFQAEKKINKLTPAVRGGEIKFRRSPYYGGRTFTTDMPNTNHGEHDWILRMEKNMNVEQITLMLECAFVINHMTIELYHAEHSKDVKKYENTKLKLDRWIERFRLLRKNSTFFYIASSLINVDFLGFDYFKEQLETMVFSEVSSSIFSITPKLEKGKQFYPTLSSKNFYTDGFNYSRIDRIAWEEEIEELSLDLKHIIHDQPLEAGLDTGNMCSLVTGQDQGNVNRVLKEFYTIPGETKQWIPELGKQFRDFYKHHREKHLMLWPDRSTHQYKKVGEDHASKFVKAIEYNEFGNSTGWVVTIMNEDQETIYHQDEFELALTMFDGSNPDLPKLLIDQHNCKCLKSSLEGAEKVLRVTPNGVKTIHKNKTSEKLPEEHLPMRSTNFSDAFKYYICRPHYMEKIAGKRIQFTGIPGVR
jgi:hypothetical protein